MRIQPAGWAEGTEYKEGTMTRKIMANRTALPEQPDSEEELEGREEEPQVFAVHKEGAHFQFTRREFLAATGAVAAGGLLTSSLGPVAAFAMPSPPAGTPHVSAASHSSCLLYTSD